MARNKPFIDSNLWIYALLEGDDQIKHRIMVELFEKLIQDQIIVSVQVINEVHWVLHRKYNLTEFTIKEMILDGIFPITRIKEINKQIYLNSYTIREQYSVSFWDSLIISSALENGCLNLYSEDLQHGIKIFNKLNIINPFKIA